ncbi:LysR substrate-binding domain-containing protein [Lysinibacillus sp. NPDC048646]|uniref:LysR substrate-binding domain-containing protein n=1 Tax=Lysinibacillus sp. NPDC048646 TaxID=3390574 RepID=UPI003D065CA4
MEFGTLDGIIGCVAAGLGVSLLPCAIAEKYMTTQSLAFHVLATKQAQIPTWFIYYNERVLSADLTILSFTLAILSATLTILSVTLTDSIRHFDDSIRP